MDDDAIPALETPPANVNEIIVARDVHKWFGQLHVLRGINLTVTAGEVVVIFGASGSGKSTFIRTINRLEQHQRGESWWTGCRRTTSATSRPSEARSGWVPVVPQFPHLTALQKIHLAPNGSKSSRADCRGGRHGALTGRHSGAATSPGKLRRASRSAWRSRGAPG